MKKTKSMVVSPLAVAMGLWCCSQVAYGGLLDQSLDVIGKMTENDFRGQFLTEYCSKKKSASPDEEAPQFKVIDKILKALRSTKEYWPSQPTKNEVAEMGSWLEENWDSKGLVEKFGGQFEIDGCLFSQKRLDRRWEQQLDPEFHAAHGYRPAGNGKEESYGQPSATWLISKGLLS